MAERTPDREHCVVCGHCLGSHNGLPPYKCSLRDCDCPFFVPPADRAATTESGGGV